MAQQYIWLDGKFVKFDDAKVHVLTHGMQYGTGIFEGIRAFKTGKGSAIFRLKDHVRRFFDSAKIHDMKLELSPGETEDAIASTVKKNGFAECYIRPFAFYNDTRLGVSPMGRRVSIAIAAISWGSYFEKEAGLRCEVSSWERINSRVLPPMAKASGNYLNSALASVDARKAGFDEAIMLSNGYVAEGPGENIFLVESGVLVTPSKESDILMGITRDSVIKIAETLGIEVEERFVHREELYTCDELFFTGTAASIVPIVEVDLRKVGNGKGGPITKLLNERYVKVVHGEDNSFSSWLAYV